jgi:DNA-binding NtrC family response regulator
MSSSKSLARWHRTPAEKIAAKRRGDVLVVDDDLSLCNLVRKCLAQDHDVVCLLDARKALELLGKGAWFDVILCDLVMPLMTGVDFYAELSKLRPELAERTVFLTGGPFTPESRLFAEQPTSRCLEKPFDLSTLRALVNLRVT